MFTKIRKLRVQYIPCMCILLVNLILTPQGCSRTSPSIRVVTIMISTGVSGVGCIKAVRKDLLECAKEQVLARS